MLASPLMVTAAIFRIDLPSEPTFEIISCIVVALILLFVSYVLLIVKLVFNSVISVRLAGATFAMTGWSNLVPFYSDRPVHFLRDGIHFLSDDRDECQARSRFAASR